MKIIDPKILASSREGCANRLTIVWENPIRGTAGDAICFDQAKRAVAGNIQQRNGLIVPFLLPRIFAVPDSQKLSAAIKITPPSAEYLFLAHRGRYSEPDYCAHGNGLLCLFIKMGNETFYLFLRRTPVSLIAFPDQAKSPQRDTREINLFNR